ncbi:MAG: hypothetical protein HC786_28485 [Richelia sp. CSU_2_1]|nr:hypothetical protein [Richelia sp. CSU_2_1]
MVVLRRYGAPPGAPGVSVEERPAANTIADPRYGGGWFGGIAKRGPTSVAIPVTSRKQYLEIFGDPKSPTWALYADASHQLPDAIEGFWQNGSGAGLLWVTRLDLDGKGKKAKKVFKNWLGADALQIEAANEGRWGGQEAKIEATPVIVASARSFTIVAPGTLTNEYIGAEAEFEASPGKRFTIVANTAANERSGETVFTCAAQWNLLQEGITGPSILAGTAGYERYPALTGTISFPLLSPLTGTVTIEDNILTGAGTLFSTELAVGDNVYFGTEARTVTSITSNTTLSLSDSYTAGNAAGQTLQRDNRVVTGTATDFQSELSVGDILYAVIGGIRQGRKVASIASDTALTLTSGFTAALSAGTQTQREGRAIVGTGTSFTTQVQVGDYIVDPLRLGSAVKVTAIASATSLTVEKPFSGNFTAVNLAKQAKRVSVELSQPTGEGLTVEIALGESKPETHFSLRIGFNGSQVLYVPDVSLDPNDPLFVDAVVSDTMGNVAYRSSGQNILSWVRATSLWSSAYTTAEGSDVRPIDGGGKVLALTATRLYAVIDTDYSKAAGNTLYLSPYDEYRNSIRVKEAVAPQDLEGTISSTGTTVNGTSTTFLTSLSVGDYLYSAHKKEARKIIRIVSDTQLLLESAFTSNAPALTTAKKSGYFNVGVGNDLTLATKSGNSFLLSYPETLRGGYQNTANTIPYYWTKYVDPDFNHVENAVYGRNMGLMRLAFPGVSSITVNKAGAAYAEAKSYEFRYEVPVYLTTASAIEAYIKQELGRNDFASVAAPSYIYIASPFGAGKRMVSAVGDIMGGESLFAVNNSGYHVMFAGRAARLPRAIGLPFEIGRSDEVVANTSGVQMLKYSEGSIIVWGGRAPSLSPSYTFLHIRRCQSNYNRIFIEVDNLQELVFRPNQPELAAQFRMILKSFARREYKKGVFSRYLTFEEAVQINTGQDVDENSSISSQGGDQLVEIINGVLSANFVWTPTGIVERLVINAGPSILSRE